VIVEFVNIGGIDDQLLFKLSFHNERTLSSQIPVYSLKINIAIGI
jgi:hypothetical protein